MPGLGQPRLASRQVTAVADTTCTSAAGILNFRTSIWMLRSMNGLASGGISSKGGIRVVSGEGVVGESVSIVGMPGWLDDGTAGSSVEGSGAVLVQFTPDANGATGWQAASK